MRRSIIVISHGFQSHYVKGFVNGLAMNGITVCLVGSDDTKPAELVAGIELRNLRGSQDPARPSWQKALNIVRYHWRLAGLVLSRRGAIVHIIGQFRHGLALAAMECMVYRHFARSLIVTVHNLLPHNKHGAWNRAWFRFIWRIPHRLVTHTESMRRDLVERFGVPAQRIVVMEHGINDEPEGFPFPCRSRGESARMPVEVQFLFFGTLSPYKGLDILLEAFDTLDERFGLVIAGMSADAEYVRAIREAVAASPNKERIRLDVGYVRDCDVPGYFRAADAIVMPYRYIDQSGVLFLAMRHGLPVVATRVGSLPDYVPEDAGILVDRAVKELLAAALRDFPRQQHRFDRSRIVQRAQSLLWSNTVKPVLPLYAYPNGTIG